MPARFAPRPRQLTALVVIVGVLGLHAWCLDRWSPASGRNGAPSLQQAMQVVRPLQGVTAPSTAKQTAARQPDAPAADRPVAHQEVAPRASVKPVGVTRQVLDLAPGAAPAAVAVEAEGEAPPVSAAEGLAPAQAPPVYATRTPDPVRLRYALQLGVGPAARSGEAWLDWQHDGERYRLELSADDRGAPLVAQVSSGVFDAAGVAPERFVDQRRGRRAQAANFQRDSGRITFSGPRIEHPAWPGAQDRLGWIVQLAGIAQAAGRVPPEVAMFVVDSRGAGDVWTFTEQGTETVDTARGSVTATKLLRQPQRLHDWRVEAWLDPQRGYWPVRLRMTLPRSGAVFELALQGE